MLYFCQVCTSDTLCSVWIFITSWCKCGHLVNRQERQQIDILQVVVLYTLWRGIEMQKKQKQKLQLLINKFDSSIWIRCCNFNNRHFMTLLWMKLWWFILRSASRWNILCSLDEWCLGKAESIYSLLHAAGFFSVNSRSFWCNVSF